MFFNLIMQKKYKQQSSYLNDFNNIFYITILQLQSSSLLHNFSGVLMRYPDYTGINSLNIYKIRTHHIYMISCMYHYRLFSLYNCSKNTWKWIWNIFTDVTSRRYSVTFYSSFLTYTEYPDILIIKYVKCFRMLICSLGNYCTPHLDLCANLW